MASIKKKIILILSFLIGLPLFLVAILFLFFEIFGVESRDNLIDAEADKISNLIHCKKLLEEENAWNLGVNYNYAFYLKDGTCPSAKNLANVEEVRKKFCEDLKKRNYSSYRGSIKEICQE